LLERTFAGSHTNGKVAPEAVVDRPLTNRQRESAKGNRSRQAIMQGKTRLSSLRAVEIFVAAGRALSFAAAAQTAKLRRLCQT
jgi:hypothetical protein